MFTQFICKENYDDIETKRAKCKKSQIGYIRRIVYLCCDMLWKNGNTKQIIKMVAKIRSCFIMTKDLFFVCLNSVNMFSFALGYVCRRKEVGFVQKATSKVPWRD